MPCFAYPRNPGSNPGGVTDSSEPVNTAGDGGGTSNPGGVTPLSGVESPLSGLTPPRLLK